jgi:uncharacterized protein
MRRVARAGVLCALCLTAGCSALTPDGRYTFNDTRVIEYATPDAARQYRFYVSLPRNYERRTTEHFPVIILLDADYSFALTRNLVRHFTDRHQAQESIIVGIAYPGADDDMDVYHRTRTRDYTPSFTLENGYGPEIQKLSGGGPAFLQSLADDILPEIDRRFRTEPAERMLVGNSFSGVFAAYALLTRPDLFRRYLIVSPSLWYDNRMIFDVAKRYIAMHRSLPVKVFWSVGGEENQPPPEGSQMVDYLLEFTALMKDAKLDGYESTVAVFEHETHNSVFPAALSRGLRVLYDFKGEKPQK